MWYLVKCDNLKSLEDFHGANGLEFYFPVASGKPLFGNLLFVKAETSAFQKLLDSQIPGLKPVMNLSHDGFAHYSDSHINMLRLILDSPNDDIIVHDCIDRNYLCGDTVLITDGPFAGIEGKQAKYKHQNRVFVEIDGLGTFGTAYVPKGWMRKVAS